jgi:hypothetical protein
MDQIFEEQNKSFENENLRDENSQKLSEEIKIEQESNIDKINDEYTVKDNLFGDRMDFNKNDNSNKASPRKETSDDNSPKKNSKTNKNKNSKKYNENIKKYFSSYTQESNEENDGNNQNILSFNKLKSLKKKVDVDKEKEINKKLILSLFELEADLGSDNEEHDENIKKISDDEIEDDNEENDLEDFIVKDEDNLNENADAIKRKFYYDLLEKDKDELRQVIHGPKKKEYLDLKRNRNADNNQDEEITIEMRMKKYISDKTEKDYPKYNKKKIINNLISIREKMLETNVEGRNEELTEICEDLESKIIKNFSTNQKDLIIRMKENEKILENVINLNSKDSLVGEDNKNPFFIKGIGIVNRASNNSVINSTSNSFQNNKPLSLSNNSHSIKNLYYNKNSFLHAMKNDKYQIKEKISEGLENLKHLNSGDSSTSTNSNVSTNNKMCSVFANNKNLASKMNPNISSNLSALFTRSNKQRHTELPKPKQNDNLKLNKF